MAWDVRTPLPGVTAAPALVLLEAHGGSSYEVRRAATLARGAWPGVRVILRGAVTGDLEGYVDAAEVRHELAGDSWHELLRHLPGPGETRTLAVPRLATTLRQLARLRSLAPPPWVLLRDDASVVEVLAANGTRVVARAGSGDVEVTRDETRLRQAEEVSAGAWPTAAELLARYQAAVARRERAWPRLRAHGDHVAVFQVPGWSSPVTLVSQVTLEEDAGRRRLAHVDLRLNGLRLGRVPRLPLLSGPAEGAAPLALAVDEAFDYRVAGPETADGEPCWRLDFEPRAPGTLPRGRAFLHRGTGELVRLETRTPGRRGPFVSTRQVDHLAPVALGGVTVRVATRIEVDELYDAAGHRTPVRRVLRLARYEVPPPDAAPVTGAVVVDLPRTASLAAAPPALEAAGGGARARVRTLAAGVLLDPGISRPLPFVGGSWSELDLLGTGTQLQVVLGGASLRVAWTQPRLVTPGWQLRLDAATALVTYNDREFRGGREVFDENLAQKPSRATLMIGRRLGSRARVQAGYELASTRLARNADTAADFVVPASPLVHGLRGELDGESGPWSLRLTLQAARRSRWDPWGRPGAEAPMRRSFQRAGGSVSCVLVARPAAQLRLDVEAMAGRHLDRFSRFGFDALENRLQGYPTGALRYERALVGRLAGSATLHPRLRVSAFTDAARVGGSSARDADGVHAGAGGALETSVLGAVVAAEWAHGFGAPRPRGGSGADVVRVTAFVAF